MLEMLLNIFYFLKVGRIFLGKLKCSIVMQFFSLQYGISCCYYFSQSLFFENLDPIIIEHSLHAVRMMKIIVKKIKIIYKNYLKSCNSYFLMI